MDVTIRDVSSTRDTQRSRVYKAERDALKPLQRKLSSLSEVKLLVRQVWASKRVAENWPKAITGYQFMPKRADGSWGEYRSRPRVIDGRGARWAWGGSTYIKIPSRAAWAMVDWVVLHELAHTIHCRLDNPRREASHGWQYCAIYLQLVLYFMGRPAHNALKAAFKANKVRFRAPRKGPELSPERKAELVGRLAAARAKKEAQKEAAVWSRFEQVGREM